MDNVELTRMVLRQGEIRLAAQLALTTAAMARATTLAGIFTAAAVGAIGYGMAGGGGGVIVSGVMLMAGAGFCIGSAWPVGFAVAGNDPENWWSDGVDKIPLAESMRRESDNYAAAIKRNGKRLGSDAARFKIGAWLGCVSPVGGFIYSVLTV